jgi:hypothetical protein
MNVLPDDCPGLRRTQLRHAHREAERAELKTLYSDFMTEAARLFGDVLRDG